MNPLTGNPQCVLPLLAKLVHLQEEEPGTVYMYNLESETLELAVKGRSDSRWQRFVDLGSTMTKAEADPTRDESTDLR
jgi:hypothetical protein